MPKFSVIVPVFNAEKSLVRCVDCLLMQTYTDFELLLIDDGSSDESRLICDEYATKDYRIRVFHKNNGGVSSARNVGLDYARGEWITFADSDDWVENNFLQNYIELIEVNKTEADMISQGFISRNWQYSKDEIIVTSPNKVINELNMFDFLIETFSDTQLGYIWCKAFKRNIINRYGIRFCTSYKIREDLAFVCQYCRHIHNISNTEKVAYHYDYPAKDKYWNESEPMEVCADIYGSLRRWATDTERLIRLKKAYVSYAICALIGNARSVNLKKWCSFFYNEFSDYVSYGDNEIKKVRLFKLLYKVRKIWWLNSIVRIIYFVIYKRV